MRFRSSLWLALGFAHASYAVGQEQWLHVFIEGGDVNAWVANEPITVKQETGNYWLVDQGGAAQPWRVCAPGGIPVYNSPSGVLITALSPDALNPVNDKEAQTSLASISNRVTDGYGKSVFHDYYGYSVFTWPNEDNPENPLEETSVFVSGGRTVASYLREMSQATNITVDADIELSNRVETVSGSVQEGQDQVDDYESVTEDAEDGGTGFSDRLAYWVGLLTPEFPEIGKRSVWRIHLRAVKWRAGDTSYGWDEQYVIVDMGQWFYCPMIRLFLAGCLWIGAVFEAWRILRSAFA